MSSDNQTHIGKPVNDGSRLLDRAVPPGYQQEWTERIAAPVSLREPEIHTVLIFRAGSEWLALPGRILDEVGERNTIHSLPHRRSGVLAGLTSVRGELLLCFSLEALLGIEETRSHDEKTREMPGRMLVVVRNGDRLAFPVSEVQGIHRYHPRELRMLPDTVSKAASYMFGLLPWRNRMVGCLDDELLFNGLHGEL
ncbi:MAG: chemotaxis protein CheW [Verrucomicrobiaceae bacterium]|nr:MAG: chemotaxis protein CheW [Verrucomicrobiaceae bacterium]